MDQKNVGIAMRKMLAALVCAAMLCFTALPAAALTETRQTVRVGFAAMDGYHMRAANGVRSGYGYDFLRLVARYSDLQMEYVGYEQTWSEQQRMLETGEIDLITAMQPTPALQEVFDFSASPVGTSEDILAVRQDDTRYADGEYDGMRIGIVTDACCEEHFTVFAEERGFSYSIVPFDSIDACVQALREGEQIDALVANSIQRIEDVHVLENFSPLPYYAAVKKGNAALLNEIDAVIARMDVDTAGWRTRLKNKYYGASGGETVAFTGEERAYLDSLSESGRVLRVTVMPDSAPYSYFENGVAKGVIPDLFYEVAARMGISYEMIEPADRAEYQRIFLNGEADVMLDGINDLYVTEIHNLEISDVYYTAPLAVLSSNRGDREIRHLAQPEVSILNEELYRQVTAGKDVTRYATLAECAEAVRRGAADGAYMCYYNAQWQCSADETNKLVCAMLPSFSRDFVYAVNADEDYLLLASLNKALGSLSEDFIDSVVSADTEPPQAGFSLLGLFYQNPGVFVLISFLIAACAGLTVIFVQRSRRERKELERGRQMERYIGYLCDMYTKVLEVDLGLHKRTQYAKRNGAVEIRQSGEFASFDIDSIHPDDRSAAVEVFAPSAIRAQFEAGEDERYVECRMRAEDGDYRWCSFLFKRIPQDEAHPCSVMLLIKDIEAIRQERERARQALVDALDAANAATRSKSAFLSGMSHEIRTPLNAVIGYMTVAENALDNREKTAHCIENAGIAAKHLLSIINDVLDVSSMESGKMKLSHERFDLKEQLTNVTAVFYQQCRQKGVRFDISVEGLSEEWIVGDAMRVNQILMNLMSNAVKFTDAGGKVNLSVSQASISDALVHIRFAVRDTGIGMANEYLTRLFAPFEQESAQTAKKYGGTGLGMAITNNLVKLMGGRIEVESEQGKGSCFTVTLPFERTDNTAVKLAAKDFARVRVLVVDDLESECEYIHALLTRCGIRAETVGSGEEAIRRVAACRDTDAAFDLCIIDWNMPDLDGVETTRRIHQECDPDIPIIIATAYDVSEFREEALAAGAAKIVAKPLFQSTLFDLLITTFGKYDVSPQDEDAIPDLTGMRVLLAEDNDMNVEVASEILDMAGVKVEVASNGAQAVERFMDNGARYDAILMDVLMPAMDGYEATRTIRASDRPNAKTIPIIAMTANAFAEDVSASLAAGMDGHVSKPVDPEQLFSMLKSIYRRK